MKRDSIEAMHELLAKDLAFFHNNYAGSLTKRALGFARRFEDVFDVMAFQAGGNAVVSAFRRTFYCQIFTRSAGATYSLSPG